VLNRMRRVHERWEFETLDLGFLPEDEIAAREQRLGSGYAILRQPGGKALLKRLRDAAMSAGAGVSALPRMVEALDDEDAGVRYWGAIGIGNLGEAGRAAERRILRACEDESASVRIAAGRALCRMDRADVGLGVVVKELEGGRPWARVQAAYVLDELDETGRPALGAMRRALKTSDKTRIGGYVERLMRAAVAKLSGNP